MKRRLKIYFIHSVKYDYNNIFYKHLLSSSELVKHELMLPQSKGYQDKYVKDLLNRADLIVAEVSNPSFTLKLELKWALKTGKPIKYISFNNTIPKKLNKLVPELDMINSDGSFVNIIEDFTNHYSNISLDELKDKTIILGELGESSNLNEEDNTLNHIDN